jgi:hypothetical protein
MPDRRLPESYRGISQQQRSLAVTTASSWVINRISNILRKPVSPGSSQRWEELKVFIENEIPPTEAARLYSQLSDTRDTTVEMINSRLSPKSLPKIQTILRRVAHGYSARTAPENLNSEELKDSFVALSSQPRLDNETSARQVEDEERVQEIFEELRSRNFAQTEADSQRLQEIEANSALYSATQSGDYSSLAPEIISDQFSFLSGYGHIRGLRGVLGRYRWLKITRYGVYQIEEPSKGVMVRAEPMTLLLEDRKNLHAIVRASMIIKTDSGQLERYFLEFWWYGSLNYRADFVEGVIGYARLAELRDAYATALLANPYSGDELEVKARLALAYNAPGAWEGGRIIQLKSRGRILASPHVPDIEPHIFTSQKGTNATSSKMVEPVQQMTHNTSVTAATKANGDTSAVTDLARSGVKFRRPRGFEPTAQGTKKRVKAGTLEGLESHRAKPVPAPKGKSVTREEQLEDLELDTQPKRPPLPRGQAPSFSRLNRFSESFHSSKTIQEQKRILKLAEADPQKAGREYQALVAEDLDAVELQEIFSRPGRRSDIGPYHEVTIEGRREGFSSKKLDQLWNDLEHNGKILLTVPKLSQAADAQLRKLGVTAEKKFGKNVLIVVRETLVE